MCKVILEKDNQNIDFIIYNLLFSRSNYCFTIEKLLEEIRGYDERISWQVIQLKIDTLIREGLIRPKVGVYCIVV